MNIFTCVFNIELTKLRDAGDVSFVLCVVMESMLDVCLDFLSIAVLWNLKLGKTP
jgi:hypothetical protein